MIKNIKKLNLRPNIKTIRVKFYKKKLSRLKY